MKKFPHPIVLNYSPGEEVEGLERVGPHEWVKLDVCIFKGDEREAQLAPRRLQVRGKLLGGPGHA